MEAEPADAWRATQAVVRRATAMDIEAIVEIERACFGYAWQPAQYAAYISGAPVSVAYIADVLDRTVGFGSITCAGGQGHIPSLAVLPDYRRNGLGSQILRHLLAHAALQQVDDVVLEVRRRNHAARAMYEEFGFEEIGLRQGYYLQPADDAVVMQLQLHKYG